MAIGSGRFEHRSLGLFVLSVFLGCAPAPRVFLQYGTQFKQDEFEKVLAENPLASSETIKLTTIGQGQSVSHHVVPIRGREKPHLHKDHYGTVVMIKGRGYLMMENRRIDLSVGDIVYIPRGVVHYFVNIASEPTVAFVVFSPPFDGKDTVPVEKP